MLFRSRRCLSEKKRVYLSVHVSIAAIPPIVDGRQAQKQPGGPLMISRASSAAKEKKDLRPMCVIMRSEVMNVSFCQRDVEGQKRGEKIKKGEREQDEHNALKEHGWSFGRRTNDPFYRLVPRGLPLQYSM